MCSWCHGVVKCQNPFVFILVAIKKRGFVSILITLQDTVFFYDPVPQSEVNAMAGCDDNDVITFWPAFGGLGRF